ENRVPDDPADVRSRQEALVLTTQSGRRRPDLHAAEPELLQTDDGPVEIADQTCTDGRLDGRRHAAQTVPFCEWSGEDQAQTRRARIEQQAGGDGAAAPDLELCARQREGGVRNDWHRG